MFLASFVSANELTFRYSADFTEQFIYLSNDVAIVKSVGPGEESDHKVYYEFVIAKWGGEPELGSFTGDFIIRVLTKRVLAAWLSADKQFVAGKALRFDFKKKRDELLYFSIRLDSGKTVFYKNISDLKKFDSDLPDLNGQSVDAFFDRMKQKAIETAATKSKQPPASEKHRK